jgi:hypothetical protein
MALTDTKKIFFFFCLFPPHLQIPIILDQSLDIVGGAGYIFGVKYI